MVAFLLEKKIKIYNYSLEDLYELLKIIFVLKLVDHIMKPCVKYVVDIFDSLVEIYYEIESFESVFFFL